jgi:hypothetical protein
MGHIPYRLLDAYKSQSPSALFSQSRSTCLARTSSMINIEIHREETLEQLRVRLDEQLLQLTKEYGIEPYHGD